MRCGVCCATGRRLPTRWGRVRTRTITPLAPVTGAHYRDTIPSALLPLMPSTSTPFCEPLSGVAVREVTDADVFRHSFGR
jgi:hypothetical protein